jgi:hypothetical protein
MLNQKGKILVTEHLKNVKYGPQKPDNEYRMSSKGPIEL